MQSACVRAQVDLVMTGGVGRVEQALLGETSFTRAHAQRTRTHARVHCKHTRSGAHTHTVSGMVPMLALQFFGFRPAMAVYGLCFSFMLMLYLLLHFNVSFIFEQAELEASSVSGLGCFRHAFSGARVCAPSAGVLRTYRMGAAHGGSMAVATPRPSGVQIQKGHV